MAKANETKEEVKVVTEGKKMKQNLLIKITELLV